MRFLCVLLLILVNTVHGSGWDYGRMGPDVWKEFNASCGGQRQSPINIRTACTNPEVYSRFQFTAVHYEQNVFNLTNNGHTIEATPFNVPKILLTGGGLIGTYTFISFHLHWGPNHNSGSEHQINGDKSAGESHFVYNNTQTGKLAVLSFLMETEQKRNSSLHRNNRKKDNKMEPQWQKYFDAARTLTVPKNSTMVSLTLSVLMGHNLKDFWRYEGSLTTPPCSEIVTWTVFKERIVIEEFDFESFRDDLFFESYRGPQQWYYRKVYRSFPTEEKSTIPDENACPSITSTATFVFRIFQTKLVLFFVNFLASYGFFNSN